MLPVTGYLSAVHFMYGTDKFEVLEISFVLPVTGYLRTVHCIAWYCQV